MRGDNKIERKKRIGYKLKRDYNVFSALAVARALALRTRTLSVCGVIASRVCGALIDSSIIRVLSQGCAAHCAVHCAGKVSVSSCTCLLPSIKCLSFLVASFRVGLSLHTLQ